MLWGPILEPMLQEALVKVANGVPHAEVLTVPDPFATSAGTLEPRGQNHTETYVLVRSMA